MVGVIGLSLVAEILHRCLPSSIVHCEHGSKKNEHEAHDQDEGFASDTDEGDEREPHGHYHHVNEHPHEPPIVIPQQTDGNPQPPMSEATPLLQHQHQPLPTTPRAPPLKLRLPGPVASLVTGKGMCVAAGDGKCYGYAESKPCDRMCLGHIKSARASRGDSISDHRHLNQLQEVVVETPSQDVERAVGHEMGMETAMHSHDRHPHPFSRPESVRAGHQGPPHVGHHHVPKNEFLSIGLQTSLAIALHKIPEVCTYMYTHYPIPQPPD